METDLKRIQMKHAKIDATVRIVDHYSLPTLLAKPMLKELVKVDLIVAPGIQSSSRVTVLQGQVVLVVPDPSARIIVTDGANPFLTDIQALTRPASSQLKNAMEQVPTIGALTPMSSRVR